MYDVSLVLFSQTFIKIYLFMHVYVNDGVCFDRQIRAEYVMAFCTFKMSSIFNNIVDKVRSSDDGNMKLNYLKIYLHLSYCMLSTSYEYYRFFQV